MGPTVPGCSPTLRDLPEPVRLANFPSYVRDLGFSADLIRSKTFQGTPMRHRGIHVGSFFLSEKEGATAFTDEDEEVLMLFASQAATAIANARAHSAEQRARADLEALVETSPGRAWWCSTPGTGRPVSFKPRGAAHRRGSAHRGPPSGGAPGGGVRPPRRRAGDFVERVPPSRSGSQHRRDRARR